MNIPIEPRTPHPWYGMISRLADEHNLLVDFLPENDTQVAFLLPQRDNSIDFVVDLQRRAEWRVWMYAVIHEGRPRISAWLNKPR